MKKLKVTKRERKAQGRNFAWMQTRTSNGLHSYDVAGTRYLGKVPEYHVTRTPGLPAVARKVKPGVPFIRIG
jgi:hypothetical protein